jgi:protein SCO1
VRSSRRVARRVSEADAQHLGVSVELIRRGTEQPERSCVGNTGRRGSGLAVTRTARALTKALLSVLLALVTSACASDDPGPPPASLGTVASRSVPAAIADLALTDQHGRVVNLAAFRKETVMVVPFLTLCTDICPLDTGNLLQVEHALSAAGVAPKVQLIELSVDPGRDSPARLAAYARLTGASWELVTESPAEATEFEHFFGWVVQQVAEDSPPPIDWWTDKPLTYDVNHTDGFVMIDGHGTERFSTAAAPNFHGTLNPTLHRFLNDEGREHLAHPQKPNWTPADALAVLGWLLHRDIPVADSR